MTTSKHDARAVGMQIESQDLLEIGEPVVAAESHVVSEEREHERVAERLRDDRKVDTGDTRSKRKPSEHQRERRRNEHHHRQRERK